MRRERRHAARRAGRARCGVRRRKMEKRWKANGLENMREAAD
jgi:hypothetical protein